MTLTTPSMRPKVPHFSSGPCAKRPGWTSQNLNDALLGRSHRSKPGKAKLKRAIDLTREILQVPADYRIGIVPASDTGAIEITRSLRAYYARLTWPSRRRGAMTRCWD